jgi:hypothetical protein
VTWSGDESVGAAASLLVVTVAAAVTVAPLLVSTHRKRNKSALQPQAPMAESDSVPVPEGTRNKRFNELGFLDCLNHRR